MTLGTATDKNTFLQIIRGERPLTDLRSLGIDIHLEDTGYVYHNPNQCQFEITADVYDLGKGFLSHLHDPKNLREWAFFVQSSDANLDVENHPAGETLLDALWRASFGESLDEKTVKVIEQFAKENRNHS